MLKIRLCPAEPLRLLPNLSTAFERRFTRLEEEEEAKVSSVADSERPNESGEVSIVLAATGE